ncbi:hypothetical protein BurJ1DRAFT_0728 [Burkholderiales bacterium JOSHI_001]|nr:hypothetical protein BurJ1DRAFT_0728 [Burkholderiales bacterium JOSHI_001]
MKRFVTTLALAFSLGATALPAAAAIVEVTGTVGATRMTMANNRGDVFWAIGSNVYLSRRTAGVYQTYQLNAGLPGQHNDLYAQLNDAGDVVWTAVVAGVNQIFYFDSRTLTARQLTFGTASRSWPRIGANGNAAWTWFINPAAGNGQAYLEYFDRAANQVVSVNSAPTAMGSWAIAFQSNGDLFWIDRPSYAMAVMKFNATARTNSLVVQRTGTSPASGQLEVNDFGDMVWREINNGQYDLAYRNVQTGSVALLTSTAAEEGSIRLNYAGDVLYKVGPSILLFDRRRATTTTVTANSGGYGDELRFNDAGDVVWAQKYGVAGTSVYVYNRVNATTAKVTAVSYDQEYFPWITGGGDVFYLKTNSAGTDGRIMRASPGSYTSN